MDNSLLLQIEKAKKSLLSSGVVCFPTETVMGLGVIFDDEDAYHLLNQIKRRPEDKPYTLMLGNIKDIEKYAYLNDRDLKIINAFMPGSVTLLLKSKDNIPNYVTHNTGIIGIRVPDFKEVQDLIDVVGKPLLVPSANRSGQRPCLTFKEVEAVFKDEVAYVMQKDAIGAKPSTIIDLTGEDVKIIREGPISLRDIERILKND